MNKEQIQALIDAKIAGQGNQVDIGGALAEILTEINNAAFAGANVQSDWNENDNTKPDFIKNKPDIDLSNCVSLTGLPAAGTISRDSLRDYGFTDDAMAAVKNGAINFIYLISSGELIPISKFTTLNIENGWNLKFEYNGNDYSIACGTTTGSVSKALIEINSVLHITGLPTNGASLMTLATLGFTGGVFDAMTAGNVTSIVDNNGDVYQVLHAKPAVGYDLIFGRMYYDVATSAIKGVQYKCVGDIMTGSVEVTTF